MLAQEPTSSPAKAWSPSTSVYTYIVPDSRDYVQPTVAADHDWLHLEARYNYENLDAGSLWAGYNFRVGDKVALEVTPMFAAVIGTLTGVAPGYELSLAWWKLDLSSESEYVFDFDESSENFFYNWSELSVALLHWFRAGLAIQRTKLYQTNRDIQRGFLVGVNYRRLDFTTYVFNPDDSPTVVLALGVIF